MSTKSCVVVTILVVLFSLLSLSTAGTATPKAKINITDILGKDPALSTFSSLLNKTGLTKEINTRQAITVLAVDNGAIGGLSAKSLDKIKEILSTHVILDYYDMAKLRQMSFKKNTTVTSLFQATGIATNLQGYLNIVALPIHGFDVVNKIRFGSAVKGAPVDIQLVSNTEFDFHKFDYVVLRVSGVIFTPGIGGWTPPPTAAPKKKSPFVAPHPNKKTTTTALSPDDDDYDTPTPEAAPPSEAPSLTSPPVSGDALDTDDADDENNNNDAASIDSPKSSALHFSSTFCFFSALVVNLVSSFTIVAL